MLQNQGKLDESESVLQGSLTSDRKIFGDDAVNTNIAVTLNNLGSLLIAQRMSEDAEVMYGGSLAMYRDIYGGDDVRPDTSLSRGAMREGLAM